MWPGGLLDYNAWYVLHRARDMEILDASFMPLASAPFVDEQARLRIEINQLGGPGAQVAYEETMRAPQWRRLSILLRQFASR